MVSTLASVRLRVDQKGLTLRSSIADDIPLELRGDSLRLRQVLLNLLSNAINFQTTRMPLGYIVWDADNRVKVWNASLVRIFGWAENEVLDHGIFDLIVPADLQAETRKPWSRVVEGGDSDAHLVLENCTRDGKRITCEWFGAPNADATGHIVGSLWMVHDITERLRIEERILRFGPNLRVERDYDRNLPAVSGDAFALGGAFMPLILNALSAMSGGGTLTLRTRLHRRENEVAVEIEDTGCGMPKEVLDRAMEPFFTTRPRGKELGLGLPAAYGAIKAHRGTIDIHSEPDRGTAVQITVPVVRDKTVTGAWPAIGDNRQAGLRILLVDDDNLVQSAISAQLRRLGHSVLLANHGQEALDKLQEGATVDLVLLDIDMPILSGSETLPRLRALRPTLPVIIETGNLDQAVEQLGKRFSDVAVLARPFHLAELKAALAPWADAVPKAC
jgi:PAS domain S-box-containing protein